jgi:thymidine phosphorylase
VTDAQIAAFTMATWFRGMAAEETAQLTLCMRDSGRVMSWGGLNGPVLDKHSTGGVGDLVSLVLGPLVASCGAFVPMISGRGLGHTGGTLDKLESIAGFDTAPTTERFEQLVRQNGIAIVGQSAELAPADRRIYAVRDVTATVSAPPLMISSILSKKLAEGLDGLVLDIKYGNGAFTTGPSEAVDLARQMTAVAANAGLSCNALVTSMNAPLASSAGNALEIAETIRFLKGEPVNPRLREVTLGLSAELLYLGGLSASSAAIPLLESALESGRAAEMFARMVAAQGGPADLLDRPEKYLPAAPVVRALEAPRGGTVSAIDTLAVGEAVVSLGGGRRKAGDTIDPAVGLSGLPMPGERIERGEPLAVIHAADDEHWTQCARALLASIEISPGAAETEPAIHGRVEGVLSNEAR